MKALHVLLAGVCLLAAACKEEETDMMSLLALGGLPDTAPLKPLELQYPESMRSEAEVAFYLSAHTGVAADTGGFQLYNAAYYASSASTTLEKRSDIRSLAMRELAAELNRLRSDIVNRAEQGSAYFTFTVTPTSHCPLMTGSFTGTTHYEIGSDYSTVWIDVTDMNLQLKFSNCVDGTVSFKDRAALGINSTEWPYNNDTDRDFMNGTIIIEHGEYHLKDHIDNWSISGESSASLPIRTDGFFNLNGKSYELNGTEEYKTIYRFSLDWNDNRIRGYDTFAGTVNGQPMTLTLPYDYNPQNSKTSTSSTGTGSKIDWTYAPTGTSQRLNSVRYLNGKFYATGNRCTLLTSSDGKTWTPVTISGCSYYSDDLNDIAGDGTNLNIVTSTGIIFSYNGTTWTKKTVDSTKPNLFGIKYRNGSWLAYGLYKNGPARSFRFAISSDGNNWQVISRDIDDYDCMPRDAYIDEEGRFRIVGESGWTVQCDANCTISDNWVLNKRDTYKSYTGIFKRNDSYYLLVGRRLMDDLAVFPEPYDRTTDWTSFSEYTLPEYSFVQRIHDTGSDIYATTENGVMKSSDNGGSWVTIGFAGRGYGFTCSPFICVSVGGSGSTYYKELP